MGKKRKKETALAVQDNTPVQKSFWGSGASDLLYGGSGLTYASRDLTFTEQGASTAFGIIVEVQRGVMFIADSIAMLPAGIYDGRTDELILSLDARTLDLSTPGATFIAAMRAYERRWMHNFIQSIIYSDWLYGESFVLRLSSPIDPATVAGVRWLNPLYVEPFIQQGRIAYYGYYPQDGATDIGHQLKPQQMAFRIHHRNPQEDLRGLSPVLSALNSMNIERNAERGIMSYFRNGMILGGVMMPDDPDKVMNEIQQNRLETKLQQMHSGVDRAFRWLIPPMKMAFQDFQQPDLEKNYAVVSAASKKIMMALGVPPELAGNPDSVSYDNADKIMTNWLKVNGKAYASKLASFINTSLLAYFEPDAAVYFKFDFSQIDRQDAALIQADYTGGVITINEARAQRGYKTDDRLDGILNFGGKPMHIDAVVREAKGVEQAPGQIIHNQDGVPIPQGDVFQYHIEGGAVDVNEVRAGLGLPPKALGAGKDDHLTQLRAQFDTMAAGVAAQIPPAIAAQMVGLQLPPGAVPTAPVQPGYPGQTIPGQLPAGQPAEPVEPQKGAASLCVMLMFENNPDLIDLQKRLMGMFPNAKWNPSSEFHATLLYAPAVTDEQVDELKQALDISPEGLVLKVGSFACFDNVGEHAMHFRIARNSDLLDMQSSLYDTCESIGMQMSGYSRPAQYTPHITMGYAPEKIDRIVFHGKVNIFPTDIVVSVERGGEYEVVWSFQQPAIVDAQPDTPPDDPAKSVTLEHGDHTHTLSIVTRDYSPDAALKELRAWYNFTARNKTHRPFAFDMLRGEPAEQIAALQASGATPGAIVEALKSRFDGSRLRALEQDVIAAFALLFNDEPVGVIKSIGDLEGDYAGRFTTMINDFRQSKPRDDGKAAGILKFLNQSFIRSAYIEGMIDGGVDDTPDDDQNAEIRQLVSDANSYVDSFISTVYGDGISDAQAAQKSGQWWGKAILPAYVAGLASVKGNQMMRFTGEDGLESCELCTRLKGQTHRLKEWIKRELVPQVNTDRYPCKGYNCKHILEPVTGKASGAW